MLVRRMTRALGAGMTAGLVAAAVSSAVADPLGPLAWRSTGAMDAALCGTGANGAGDVNGDGYDDVIVGSPGFANGQWDEGRAQVFLGSAAGLDTAAAWTVEGNVAGGEFGFAVSSAGDVNHDGYADVLVGAHFDPAGGFESGKVFLYLGSASGLSAVAAWSAGGTQIAGHLGASVAAAGDVNHDGFDDVIVGADRYDNTVTDEGAAFVYLGKLGGLAATPVWSGYGVVENADYGQSVSGAGDVNGDGFDDIIVGAWRYNYQGPAGLYTVGGRAFVYFGSASGPSVTPSWTQDIQKPNASFGQSVAGAGDVNGDGYDDILVGAERYTSTQAYQGAVFLFGGSPAGPGAVATWTGLVDAQNVRLGYSCAGVGDVNGDGVPDILAGGFRYTSETGQYQGIAALYLGHVGGLPSSSPDWQALGDGDNARLGLAMGAAGDVNGDGLADIIAGEPQASLGHWYGGAAEVFHGMLDTLHPAKRRGVRR